MIKVIKEAIKERAYDKKDDALRVILTRNKDTGTLLLAPFQNSKRLTFPRKEIDCIIESPTTFKDFYNTEIFEGDKVKYSSTSEILTVKKDKKGKFLLKGKSTAIPLNKIDQFEMTITGHHLVN